MPTSLMAVTVDTTGQVTAFAYSRSKTPQSSRQIPFQPLDYGVLSLPQTEAELLYDLHV